MKLIDIISLFSKIDASPYLTYAAGGLLAAMWIWYRKLRHDAMTKRDKTRQQRQAQSPPIAKRWR